jgi:ATP/maltotriose-dependent transcriptional regulator MalT
MPSGNRTKEAYERLKGSHEEMLRCGSSSWLNRAFEVEMERPDGTRCWLQSAVFPIVIGERRIYGSFNRDITELKLARQTIEQHEKELSEQNELLRNKNIAFKEMMDQLEEEKKRLARQVHANVERVILPIIMQAQTRGGDAVRQHLGMLEESLREITSVFGSHISDPMLRLTPREVKLCTLVRRGATSKEIANMMSISCRTVEIHRARIRKKLGLADPSVNLTTFLESIAG